MRGVLILSSQNSPKTIINDDESCIRSRQSNATFCLPFSNWSACEAHVSDRCSALPGCHCSCCIGESKTPRDHRGRESDQRIGNCPTFRGNQCQPLKGLPVLADSAECFDCQR